MSQRITPSASVFQPSIRIALDTAQTNKLLAAGGHYLQIVRASSATAEINVSVNAPDNRSFGLRSGEGWKHSPFTSVYLTWTAQAGAWVDIVIGGNPKLAQPELAEMFIGGAIADVSIVTDPVNVDITAQTLARMATRDDPRDVVADTDDIVGKETWLWSTVSTSWAEIQTVPAGKVWHIKAGYLSCNGATGDFRIASGAARHVHVSHQDVRPIRVWENYILRAGDRIQGRSSSGATYAILRLCVEQYTA